MNNLSKKDFDTYIGKDSFYSQEDKDRFFNRSMKTKRQKHLVPQLLSVAFVLGIFIIGANFMQNTVFPSSNDELGPEMNLVLTEVDTMKKVEEYYYQVTPGLGRAEELGLVTKVDKTLAIKEGYDLHIDKVWYNSENIHVYYSIGIPEMKTDYHNTVPAISNIKILGDQDGRFLSQDSGPSGGNNGIPVYDKRVYNHISLLPLKNHNFESIDQIEDLVSIQITTELAYKDFHDLEEIEIPLKYDREKEKTFTMTTPLNETIIFPGGRIVMDKLEIGITKNQIYANAYFDEDIHLINGDGTVTSDSGDTSSLYFYKEDRESTSIIMETEAFHEVPEVINIQINNIILYGDDSFNFIIDLVEYAEIENQSNIEIREKVAEIKNTDIYLEKLNFNGDGLRFTILYEPKNKEQSIQLIPSSTNEFSPGYEEMPNIISVINGVFDSYPPHNRLGNGFITDSSYSHTILKDYVESSEIIDVTFLNLPYLVKVNQFVTVKLNID